MQAIVISGSGLFTPPASISNAELVASYNQYVAQFNEDNASAIKAGDMSALQESSADFIEQASGIKQRYVMNRVGILDPKIMAARIPERDDSEPSLQCEMAVEAARKALKAAKKKLSDVDAVICAATSFQRPFPSIAAEVQDYLGVKGYAFDMNVACCSAIFGIGAAYNAIVAEGASVVLVINPEICTAQTNFHDRDSHYLYGDAATAVVVESSTTCRSKHAFAIRNLKQATKFSNAIRSNFGFMNRTDPERMLTADKYFVQHGAQVVKEGVPWVAKLLKQQLTAVDIQAGEVERLWLHQANANMNRLIVEKVLGREAEDLEAPMILDEYANTGSAGAMIAFHKYHSDLNSGDIGILSSFGAGYSFGSLVLEKL